MAVRMMLCDQNVWLALLLPPHLHHAAALDWWNHLQPGAKAHFCRSTQQGLLRLLTTSAVFKPYDLPPRTRTEAWEIYKHLVADPFTGFLAEPDGLDPLWEKLCSSPASSPKLWMDAYLASFAIRSGCTLVTFDQGFRQFTADGLDLRLLA